MNSVFPKSLFSTPAVLKTYSSIIASTDLPIRKPLDCMQLAASETKSPRVR